MMAFTPLVRYLQVERTALTMI